MKLRAKLAAGAAVLSIGVPVAMAANINGTDNADLLFGTNRADLILAAGGGDYVNGLRGNDRIRGGLGNDVLHGARGADRVAGGDPLGADEPGAGEAVVEELAFEVEQRPDDRDRKQQSRE